MSLEEGNLEKYTGITSRDKPGRNRSMRVLAEGHRDPRPPPEARKRQGKIHPESRRSTVLLTLTLDFWPPRP